MKVFLSYRRNDTGGRAGRLFDLLAGRWGPRNVFQDVTDIAPGLDFTVQVDAAIATCDVMLVVIGTRWLETDDAATRRIDRPDDLVREEVRRALATTIPVVPVLVDGASLPDAASLPDDIAPLALRQSVRLDDTTWHDDVNRLIRRLEGDHRIATIRQRRWPIAAATGAAVIVLAFVGFVLVRRDGNESSSQPLPPCIPDDTLTQINSADWKPSSVESEEGPAEYDLRGGAWQSEGGDRGKVVLDVAVTNTGDPAAAEEIYVDSYWFPGLLVDGVVQQEVSCWGPVKGAQSVRPDQTVIITLGFDSQIDPAGARIDLELIDLSVLPVAPDS